MQSLDAFALRMRTQEGYPLLVGGFCRPGSGKRTATLFSGLDGAVFGTAADPYLVDRTLVSLLQDICAHHKNACFRFGVSTVAGAVCTPFPEEPCGAVLGNVFSSPESSSEDALPELISPPSQSFFLLSYPGNFGVVIQCSYSDAVRIGTKLRGVRHTSSMPDDVMHELQKYSTHWLFVADSSGAMRPSTSLAVAASNGIWRMPLDHRSGRETFNENDAH